MPIKVTQTEPSSLTTVDSEYENTGWGTMTTWMGETDSGLSFTTSPTDDYSSVKTASCWAKKMTRKELVEAGFGDYVNSSGEVNISSIAPNDDDYLIQSESLNPDVLEDGSYAFENIQTTGTNVTFNGTNVLARNIDLTDSNGMTVSFNNAEAISNGLNENGEITITMSGMDVYSNSHTTTNSEGDIQSYERGDSLALGYTMGALNVGVSTSRDDFQNDDTESDTLQSNFRFTVDQRGSDEVTSYDVAKSALVDAFVRNNDDFTNAVKYVNVLYGDNNNNNNNNGAQFVDYLEENPEYLYKLSKADNSTTNISGITDIFIDGFTAEVSNKILNEITKKVKLIHENVSQTTVFGNTQDIKLDERRELTGKNISDAFGIDTTGDPCIKKDTEISVDYKLPTGQILKICKGATFTINSDITIPDEGNCQFIIEEGGKLVIGKGKGKLTIGSGNQIINKGTIENNSTIVNNTSITNVGTIDNTGLIRNTGTIFNMTFVLRSGTITNNDTIDNDGGTIDNDGGTISNNGTINSKGTIENNSLINNNADGTVTFPGTPSQERSGNVGTINQTGGEFNNNSGAIINNTGIIKIHSNYDEITMNNTGTINNKYGSEIRISSPERGGYDEKYLINKNKGIINTDYNSIIIIYNNKGLQNYGTINHNGLIIEEEGGSYEIDGEEEQRHGSRGRGFYYQEGTLTTENDEKKIRIWYGENLGGTVILGYVMMLQSYLNTQGENGLKWSGM